MKKHFLLFVLICSVLTTLLAQKNITGTVFNDKNEPLVGANIILKGTTLGAISDIDGKYEINIPSKPYSDTLICSFIGHQSEVLTIQSDNVDFNLSEGLHLQEVLIKAYSSYKGGCFCCGFLTSLNDEDWQNPLSPTPSVMAIQN